MKAVTYSSFGDARVLTLSEVEAPAPRRGEVLVRVHAASINPIDWLDFIEAATVPVVAVAALVGLRDVGGVKQGMRVLINGCTGGVSLYALQLARHLGAHVTGVCGTEGVALANEFGAHEVLDYRKQPLASHGARYDALFELSGRLPFEQARGLLTEHGVYIDPAPNVGSLVGNTLANPFRAQKHRILLSAPGTQDLAYLTRLFEQRVLRPRVDRVFPLAEVREAFAYTERGGVMGKVAVRISE